MTPEENRRLSSWKQIARYLGRDRRTVMRWEKGAGMPVHRVPSSAKGSSVYAFTRELDDWLSGQPEPQPETTACPTAKTRRWTGAALVLGTAVVLAAAFALITPRSVDDGDPALVIAGVQTGGEFLAARSLDGSVAWTYRHPEGYLFQDEAQKSRVVDLDGDGSDELLLAANTRAPWDERFLRGELLSFSADGVEQWRRIRDDVLHFGAGSFAAPWVSHSVDVLNINGHVSVVWQVHHSTWWPSIILIMNGRGELTGKFVNSGWVLADNSLSRPEGDLLLLGGITNSRRSAMLTVLDGESMWGRSPEEPGGEYECRDCPTQEPLKYFVFPPTHVNRASGLPYNQALKIQTTEQGLAVMVLEGVPHSGVQWVYEFSLDFELLRVTPGDSYWPQHRLLRLQGKIDHSEEVCPERVAPPILSWTPDGGWVEMTSADA